MRHGWSVGRPFFLFFLAVVAENCEPEEHRREREGKHSIGGEAAAAAVPAFPLIYFYPPHHTTTAHGDYTPATRRRCSVVLLLIWCSSDVVVVVPLFYYKVFGGEVLHVGLLVVGRPSTYERHVEEGTIHESMDR